MKTLIELYAMLDDLYRRKERELCENVKEIINCEIISVKNSINEILEKIEWE